MRPRIPTPPWPRISPCPHHRQGRGWPMALAGAHQARVRHFEPQHGHIRTFRSLSGQACSIARHDMPQPVEDFGGYHACLARKRPASPSRGGERWKMPLSRPNTSRGSSRLSGQALHITHVLATGLVSDLNGCCGERGAKCVGRIAEAGTVVKYRRKFCRPARFEVEFQGWAGRRGNTPGARSIPPHLFIADCRASGNQSCERKLEYQIRRSAPPADFGWFSGSAAGVSNEPQLVMMGNPLKRQSQILPAVGPARGLQSARSVCGATRGLQSKVYQFSLSEAGATGIFRITTRLKVRDTGQ